MRAAAYSESKWIGGIGRRWIEAVNEKCVIAVAGSSIDRDVFYALVRWSIDCPAQVVVIESGGRSPVVKGNHPIGEIDVLLVRQSQMQIEIRRSGPDELPADDAGATYWNESAAGA